MTFCNFSNDLELKYFHSSKSSLLQKNKIWYIHSINIAKALNVTNLKLLLCVSLREKCPNKELFLARIFPYSDWIRTDASYLSVFSPNAGKYGPEITPYLDTFRAVQLYQSFIYEIANIFKIYIQRTTMIGCKVTLLKINNKFPS